MGTVPYDENLSEQVVFCPKYREKFYRWRYVRSFYKIKIKLVDKNFSNVIVLPKMFIFWNILNWKCKIATIINYLFYYVGIKKSGLNLNLYFEGTKI